MTLICFNNYVVFIKPFCNYCKVKSKYVGLNIGVSEEYNIVLSSA